MRGKGILIILAWMTATILLAPGIDIYNYTFIKSRSINDEPVFSRLLGEGRSVVSALFLLQADQYFHGGIRHVSWERREVLLNGGHGEGRPSGEHPRKEKHTGISRFNILFRVPDEISVTEHMHLHGDQIKEIIPWLYYSARVDPHNILAYTLTAYYLADVLGRSDQAVTFLREGLRSNPDSWEIYAELGRIYFEHFRDYEAAVRVLSRAGELLDKTPHDKFQERFVLSFLAFSYEALGRDDEALPLYRRLNELFPKSGIYEKKIGEITAVDHIRS